MKKLLLTFIRAQRHVFKGNLYSFVKSFQLRKNAYWLELFFSCENLSFWLNILGAVIVITSLVQNLNLFHHGGSPKRGS